MIYDEGKRMTFGDYVDKTFAAILISICAYVATQITAVQKDLKELNKNLAVTINQVSNQKESINELKIRVLRLERGKQ